MVLAIGLPDYFTPRSMTFTLFYLLTVICVGWGAGKWPAFLTSFVVVIVVSLAQWVLPRHWPHPEWVVIWDVLSRLALFCLVGWVSAEVGYLTRGLRTLVDERTAQWKAEAAEHKATAGRLADAIERFEEVIHNITEVFWLSDVSKQKVFFVSPGYERVWGRKCEELYRAPESWLAAVHPADREAVARRAHMEQAGGGYQVEYRILRPDGAERWIRDRAFPVRNASGEVCRIAGIAEDITERKQAEVALAKKEELYRTLFELSPDGILLEDTDGNVFDVNKALCHCFGYTRNELLGWNVRGLVVPERQGEVEEHLAALRSGATLQHEVWNVRKNGEHCLMWLNERLLDLPEGRRGVVVVARDITQSKRAELTQEVLLSLGGKLSTASTPLEAARAICAAADRLWNWDAAALDLYNPETDRIEAVLNCDVMDGHRQEVPATFPPISPSPRMLRVMRQGAELILDTRLDITGTDSVAFGDTSRATASKMCVPIRRDGEAVGVLSIQSYAPDAFTEDDLRTLQALADHCGGAIERIRTEEALQQREQLNRAILATAMDGYYILNFAADPLGRFVEANEAFCRMTGYTREELLGMRIADIDAVEDAEEVARHREKIMAQHEDRFETRHRRKDGREVAVEISVTVLPGKPGGVFGFVRDITERKRVELAREAFLSLGAKLSAAQTPVEAARTVYAAADRLWDWDSATMSLCPSGSDAIEPVLFVDLIDGQRLEVDAVLPGGAATARMRRVMHEGPELILRREGEPADAETIRFGDISRASASIMCVPFRREGRAVGFLSIQSYRYAAFTPEDLRTLVGLADYCGGALERIRVESALRESEQLLRAFYDSPGGLRAIVELLEDDLLVVSANAPQAAVYGLSTEAIRHRRATELGVPKTMIDFWMEKLRQSQQDAAPVTFEYSADFRSHGGWGLATVSPLGLRPPGPPRFAYVAVDITGRKRGERIKEAFLSLGAKLSVAKTPREAAEAVLAGADQLWKWDAGVLQLYSVERDCLDSVLLIDLVDNERREVPPPYPDSTPPPVMRRIMQNGPELILRTPADTQRSEFVAFGDMERLSASLMYAPLRREGQTVGVLSIQSYAFNAYTPDDLQTLQALADYCGGALQRIQAEALLRAAHAELEQRVKERTAELRAANTALRESQAHLELALDASGAGTWSWEAASSTSTWDDRYHQLYGFGPEVPRSHEAWLSRVHPQDRERLLARIERLLEPGSGDLWHTEFRALLPVQGERWMEGRGRVERDAAGRAVRFTGINLDITERKHAEEDQRAQLAYIQSLYRSTPVGLCVLDADFRYVRINDRLAVINGLSVDKHLGRTVREVIPHLAERIEAVCRQVSATGQPVQNIELEGPTAARPGEIRNWVAHWVPLKQPDGSVTGFSCVVEEITERKKMEQALREAHDQLEQRVRDRTAELQAANAALQESEARYRSLVDNLSVGVFRVTTESGGRFIQVNPALARIHGYDSVEEFQKVKAAELYQHPRDRAEYLSQLREKGALRNYEVRLRKRDGTPIHGSLTVRLHRDAQAQPAWVEGVLEDITERKKAEEALRATEERYRTLAESSPDAIFILDRDGRLQYVNSTAAAWLKRAPEELIGLNQAKLFPPEIARSHQQAVREVFETGNSVHRDEPLTLPVGDRWVEVRLAPLYDARGVIASVMGISRDITERKHAERELAEALDLNQRILAASPIGIEAFKASGECIFVNYATRSILGGTLPELLGRNFRKLRSWMKAGLLQLADAALASGHPQATETHRVSSHGREVWADLRMARFTRGGQLHLLCMHHDISERKHAEAALREAERLRTAILDNIPDPAWLKDAEGRFLAGNEALAHSYGRPLAAIIGKRISDFAPEEVTRVNHEDEKVMKSRRPLRAEVPFEQPHRQIRWFESIKSPLFDQYGKVIGTVGIAREISDYKRTELLLRAQRDLGAGLGQTSDLPVALKHLLDVALRLGGLDSGGVYLLDPGTRSMSLIAHRGASPAFIKAASHWPPDSPQMRLVLRGRPIFSPYQGLALPHDTAHRREGLRASAFIPLSHEGKPIGALILASKLLDEIPRPTQLTLEAIAAQAAGALARIQAETERRRLERQVLEISDRQQATIGQEIHDGLCQHLISLAFDANSLLRELSAQRRPESKTVRRIARCLDDAITETRQLSRGLFPARLVSTGLPPALEELAKTTAARFKLRCRFTSRGPVAAADSTSATHLYRIAQEAVANAIRHSQARNVLIRLRADAKVLELSVEDDGRGLASTRRKEASGLGLHIMDYRARAIGGRFRLRRSRRGGTLVSCCVPCQRT